MLDDLHVLHEKDKSGALQIAAHGPEQLRHSFAALPLQSNVKNVVYAGMGGSALAARLSVAWPAYKVPFEICTDYHVPAYVDQTTLVIAASYSGNTEESIAAYDDARQKGAQVVVIAGGGALIEAATRDGVPFIVLPKAAQPRFAVFYCFKALIDVLESAGLVHASDVESVISAAADHLEASLKNWLIDVPTAQNPAKQLALDLVGTSPVVYAGPALWPAAYKWKISFNENAKNVAWAGSYPEFCHNEFIGWSVAPVEKPYSVIDLRSSFDHERITKRFEIVDRLLSGKRPAAKVVQAQGETLFSQLVYTVAFGDFVSLYVGLLNNIDPTPVALVEKLKEELTK